MATDETQSDDFRTALEIANPDADVRRGADSIQFCLTCSKIAGRQAWTGHRMQENGSYECLTCRYRQVPAEQQATDAEVKQAVEGGKK